MCHLMLPLSCQEEIEIKRLAGLVLRVYLLAYLLSRRRR